MGANAEMKSPIYKSIIQLYFIQLHVIYNYLLDVVELKR